MSERSEELQRQRDLLREHLDWLEREIASQEASEGPGDAEEPPVITRRPLQPQTRASDSDAERILEEFRRSSPAMEAQAKRGCLLYFSVAMALLLLGAFAVVMYYVRARQAH